MSVVVASLTGTGAEATIGNHKACMAFVPAADMTITELALDWQTDQAGTFRVGISTNRNLPTVYVDYVDVVDPVAGVLTVTGLSAALTAGVTYYVGAASVSGDTLQAAYRDSTGRVEVGGDWQNLSWGDSDFAENTDAGFMLTVTLSAADVVVDPPPDPPPGQAPLAEDTVRAQLAAALVDALDPSVKVRASADGATPETDHDLVMVVLEKVSPGRTAGGTRTCSFQLLVSVALTKPGLADDALEDHLGAVLDALDDVAWITWQDATRSLYTPSVDGVGFPAFTITASVEVQPS